jgi:hypothetical protein
VLLSQLGTVLGDRCAINLKPVIDLPAAHIPVDSYEIARQLCLRRGHLARRGDPSTSDE